jgi:hypothetical protein
VEDTRDVIDCKCNLKRKVETLNQLDTSSTVSVEQAFCCDSFNKKLFLHEQAVDLTFTIS